MTLDIGSSVCTWTEPSSPRELTMPSLDIGVGRMLAGRYELRRCLGAGGMGKVFLAKDWELDEEVALKVLLPSHCGEPQALERLRREVKLARRITHRNVCRAFDFGEELGIKFLTMEFVCGEPLCALLARGHVPPDVAFSVLDQVIAGLGAAHAEGVLHHDLKPENVMICADGRVVIVDFGLARSLGQSATVSAARAGTPAYMSPEQIRGEPMDARSDVFSLGILAFEVLSGQWPFERCQKDGVVGAILSDAVRPLVVPGLPPAVVATVAQILSRALAKRPEARLSSVEELGAKLRAARGATAGRGASKASVDEKADERHTKPRASKSMLARAAAFLGIAATTLGVGFVGAEHRPHLARATSSLLEAAMALDERPLVRIAPFDNQTGNARFDALARGSFSSIRAELHDEPSIRVEEADTAAKSVASPTWVVVGRVFGVPNQLRVGVQIVGADGVAASESVEVGVDEDQAADVTGRLRVLLRDEFLILLRARTRRREAERGTRNAEARAALLKYDELVGPGPRIEVLDNGRRLLEVALAADPRYVPALLELSELVTLDATTNARAAGFSESLTIVERALSIAPDDPRGLLMRCRAMERDLIRNQYPTDERIARTMDACNAAGRALPRSGEVLQSIARLSDLSCQDELAMVQLTSAAALDRSLSGPVLLHLVGLALDNGMLYLADDVSARLVEFADEQARLGGKSIASRAGLPVPRAAHGYRAVVLMRLGRLADARAHFEHELRNVAAGMGNKWIESMALRGLLQIAAQKGEPSPPDLVRRLANIEAEYRAASVKDPRVIERIAGAYRFVAPRESLRWIERRGRPANFREALFLAMYHHQAGDDVGARRVFGAYAPRWEWERRCEARGSALLAR